MMMPAHQHGNTSHTGMASDKHGKDNREPASLILNVPVKPPLCGKEMARIRPLLYSPCCRRSTSPEGINNEMGDLPLHASSELTMT